MDLLMKIPKIIYSLLNFDKNMVNISPNPSPVPPFTPNISTDDFIVQTFFVKQLDNNGIPSVYYGTTIDGKPIGFHRNPVSYSYTSK